MLVKLLHFLILPAYDLVLFAQFVEVVLELILVVHKEGVFAVDALVEL